MEMTWSDNLDMQFPLATVNQCVLSRVRSLKGNKVWMHLKVIKHGEII